MLESLTPIWQRLDSPWLSFFRDELTGLFNGLGDRLVDLRVLREVTPSLTAPCPGCGKGYLGHVVWTPDTGSGVRRALLPCPVCGPIPIEADSLRRWSIDVPTLLLGVVEAAHLRQALVELVPEHLWYLGAARWCGRSQQVYFARSARGHVRATVRDTLAAYPKAVLLLATELAAAQWAVTPNPVIALESVVSFGAGGLTFDSSLVESRLADAGKSREPGTKKQPLPKRASRHDDIARLTRVMVKHLRAAREHAYATLAMGKLPELLPRPTKKRLAQETGLSPPTVTKCFKDETARELNLYWEMALDLPAVLRFRGPISTGPEE